MGDKARRTYVTPKMTHTPLFNKCLRLNASMASVSGEHPRMTETARGRLSHLIMGLLHNLGDGCRGQNRGRDGRGTATGGPR